MTPRKIVEKRGLRADRIAIQVIREQDFEQIARAADEGQEDAREFILAFLHWNELMTQEIEEGGSLRPRCFSCSTQIKHLGEVPKGKDDNFGGMAFGKLDDDDGDVEGYACPFCYKCQLKGWEKLKWEFAKMMEKDLGLIGMEPLH
jgi:hypothetical protein